MLENEKIWILQNILSNVEGHNSAKLLRESLFKVIDGLTPLITASGAGLYQGKISPNSSIPSGISQSVFAVTEPGTYMNFGNVNLPANHFGFIFWDGNQFSISTAEIPMQDLTPINNRVTEVENNNTQFQNNINQRIDDLETEQQDFIDNFSVEVDQEFDESSYNAISNRTVTRVVGDYPIVDTIVNQNIGLDISGDTDTFKSTTNKYYLTNYTSNVNGIINKVNIRHGAIAVGSLFTIVQMRRDGNNFTIINEQNFNISNSNSINQYLINDWDYQSGDYIGIKVDEIAGISRFTAKGYNGIISVTTDLVVGTGDLSSYGMAINFDISTKKPAIISISERLNKLENNTPDSNYLPRPVDGVVNFQVPVNCNFNNAPDNNLHNQEIINVHYDFGILLLPVNYSQIGQPIRLVIACHGTGTWINGSTTTTTHSSQLLSQGYAVLDMNGIPASFVGSSGEDITSKRHYGAPFVLDSYIQGYRYVTSKYNIAKDGCFVYGISMGGLAAFLLTQSNSIPVIAQGAFCPCIDLFKQAYVNPWNNGTDQRAQIAQYFNFEGTPPTFTNQKPPTQAEIDYFLANKKKWIGWNSMLKNIPNLNISDIYNIIPEITDVENEVESNEYSKFYKLHPVPLKIFHNKDDATVRWRYSKYYVDMVNKMGGTAVLRTFPSGAHNAWLNGDTVSDIPTINGGKTSMLTSIYELIQWFKRFDR